MDRAAAWQEIGLRLLAVDGPEKAYGDGYITSGELCWGPGQVGLFLADWIPRKAVVDPEQRAALPDVLRRWIRYALESRGVDREWIGLVVDAVDVFLPPAARVQAGLLRPAAAPESESA